MKSVCWRLLENVVNARSRAGRLRQLCCRKAADKETLPLLPAALHLSPSPTPPPRNNSVRDEPSHNWEGFFSRPLMSLQAVPPHEQFCSEMTVAPLADAETPGSLPLLWMAVGDTGRHGRCLCLPRWLLPTKPRERDTDHNAECLQNPSVTPASRRSSGMTPCSTLRAP